MREGNNKEHFNGLLLKRKRTKVVHKSKSMSKGFNKDVHRFALSTIRKNFWREKEREIILGNYTWVTYYPVKIQRVIKREKKREREWSETSKLSLIFLDKKTARNKLKKSSKIRLKITGKVSLT